MWRGMGEVGVQEEMQVGLSFRNGKIRAAQGRRRGFGVGEFRWGRECSRTDREVGMGWRRIPFRRVRKREWSLVVLQKEA